MIKDLAFSRLANGELYQFLKLVVDKVKEADTVASKLKTANDPLEAILPRLLAALNKEQANEETKELTALDKKRDNAIIGFNLVIDGYKYHEDNAKKEAAFLLGLYIDAQGKAISRQNYSIETTSLTKITTAFKTEAKYVAAVALLNVGDWVANLETANNQFENKFKSRNTSQSETKDLPPFGEVRKEAVPLYNELTALIEGRFKTAKADKQPTDPYHKLINELNTLVDTYVPYTITKNKAKPETPAQ